MSSKTDAHGAAAEPFDFDRPVVVDASGGDAYHFLNHLAVTKVPGEATGTTTVVEFTAPRGFAPPLHSHRYEDELLIVLDGTVDLIADERSTTAGAGDVAWLPHGVPHTFMVTSETARFLTVATARNRAPEFDRFVADLGTATDVRELPEEGPIDGALVADVGRAHAIDILGPPPVV